MTAIGRGVAAHGDNGMGSLVTIAIRVHCAGGNRVTCPCCKCRKQTYNVWIKM